MDGAIVTEVNRKTGTITVSSFDSVLKGIYRADKVQKLFREELPFFAGAPTENVDGPYEFRITSYPAIQVNAPGFAGRMMMPGSPAGQLSPAGLMALTTLAGLEWLRRRKDAVAEAERTGDYSSLVDDFCDWLRGILRAWREALAGTETRGRSDTGARSQFGEVHSVHPVVGSKPAGSTVEGDE